jgi:hypothetical protein
MQQLAAAELLCGSLSLVAHQSLLFLPCSVAFAVLAAAQTAAAVALRQGFSSSTLSEQDFYMCRTADQILERGCSSGWSLKEGMYAFVQLQRRQQLPVVEACRRYAPLSPSRCGPAACTTTLPQLLQGGYKIYLLGSIWEMQRHIRQHGSIVCGMQLYSDTKSFFAANPRGVYKEPGGCLKRPACGVEWAWRPWGRGGEGTGGGCRGQGGTEARRCQQAC